MSANWSKYGCLNQVVDSVADELADFGIYCNLKLIKFQAEDDVNSPVLPHSWGSNMKDYTTPKKAGLQKQVGNWRLVICLQER